MVTRVLFTESSRNIGGQELQALQQMGALKARGLQVCLACRPDSEIIKRASTLDIPLYPISFRNSLHLPSILAMRQLIQQWQPDAIISHSGHDANISQVAARLVRLKPILVRSKTYHAGKPKAWTYNYLSDLTVVPSQYLKNQLLSNQRILPHKIKVLYPGIDFEQLFRQAEEPLVDAVADWLNNKKGPILVQAAMLRAEKGHRFMLEVVAGLLKGYPGLAYVIAGDGVERDALIQRVRELGIADHVFFAGVLNPVAPLLRIADLVVMPSFYEPLGMAQIEALALGVPVVASKIGGIPETIEHGKSGWLVEAGNAEAWINTLKIALSDKNNAKSMANQGKIQSLSKFSLQANADNLLADII